MSKQLGVIAALVAAVGYGGVGVMLTFAKDAQLDGAVILAWRFTITAVLLWLLRATRSRTTRRIRSADLQRGMLLGGLLYASQCYTYFAAVGRLGAGKTAVILYTYPAMVIVFQWIRKQTQPSFKTGILLMLAFLGTSLTVYQPGGTVSAIGLTYAVTTALVYTAYLLASARFVAQIPPEDAATIVSTGAALAFWLAALSFSERYGPAQPHEWLPLVTMATFCTLIPLIAAFTAVKSLGPERTALICMLEPVVATWLGIALLGESISLPQVLGTILVLATSYLLQSRSKQLDTQTNHHSFSTHPTT